jgi:hypothetical protein
MPLLRIMGPFIWIRDSAPKDQTSAFLVAVSFGHRPSNRSIEVFHIIGELNSHMRQLANR